MSLRKFNLICDCNSSVTICVNYLKLFQVNVYASHLYTENFYKMETA